jgi:hypothetical protein
MYEVKEAGEDAVRIIIYDTAGMQIYCDSIPGNIQPETCKRCGSTILYSFYADATYCGKCNEWLESNCGDPECEYCRDRPEQPLKM